MIAADDGLPAEEVGEWAREKHAYLCRYLDASRGARRRFIGAGKAGATFVDLFCSAGRAKIRGTNDFIDGSALAAWRTGAAGSAPFSRIYIADLDPKARDACAQRLAVSGAPYTELAGDAVAAAEEYRGLVNKAGLHLAFLDPYGIGGLDFRIIQRLAELQRIDMLIHVSAMDLQRNLSAQITDVDAEEFDSFAPGWRDKVNTSGTQADVRGRLLAFWGELVQGLGMKPFSDTRLIRATKGQRLYWLMLASRSPLAHELWRKIGAADRQPGLGL